MIKLIMLTGFLGAGKTTFLKRLIEEYSEKKIGVLINEFGAINVDAELVKEDGIDMMELSNGSIFCACIKDKFVESLIEMSSKDIDYLFIEASGLADPANMPTILKGVEHRLARPYDYAHSICIVDGTGFAELSEVLVALKRQVAYSDIVIVNKADLISGKEFEEICRIIGEINTNAFVVKTSYCNVDIRDLIESASTPSGAGDESTNTFESRPQTVILKEKAPVSCEKLAAFLEEIAGSTYRIKGFLNGENGPLEVSCVGERIQVDSWERDVEEGRLVVISSVGIKIISIICEAIERHVSESIAI